MIGALNPEMADGRSIRFAHRLPALLSRKCNAHAMSRRKTKIVSKDMITEDPETILMRSNPLGFRYIIEHDADARSADPNRHHDWENEKDRGCAISGFR